MAQHNSLVVCTNTMCIQQEISTCHCARTVTSVFSVKYSQVKISIAFESGAQRTLARLRCGSDGCLQEVAVRLRVILTNWTRSFRTHIQIATNRFLLCCGGFVCILRSRVDLLPFFTNEWRGWELEEFRLSRTINRYRLPFSFDSFACLSVNSSNLHQSNGNPMMNTTTFLRAMEDLSLTYAFVVTFLLAFPSSSHANRLYGFSYVHSIHRRDPLNCLLCRLRSQNLTLWQMNLTLGTKSKSKKTLYIADFSSAKKKFKTWFQLILFRCGNRWISSAKRY